MNPKKIAFFIILVISLIIINNLVQSIYSLSQKQHLVSNARLELDREKKKNQELKDKLKTVDNPQFLEQEARNKLFLGKSGEGVILIPKDALVASNSGKPKIVDTRPNWKKWWDVLF